MARRHGPSLQSLVYDKASNRLMKNSEFLWAQAAIESKGALS